MSWKRSRLTAAGVAAACGLMMLGGVSLLADSPSPTLHIEGMRLQNVLNSDGSSSIQALVDVYVSDVPKFMGGSLLLKYNSDYWQPSRVSNNETDLGSDISAFFATDPDIYGGSADPFLFENEGVRTQVDTVGGALALGFNLKEIGDLPDVPGDKVKTQTVDKGTGAKTVFTYIEAEDKVHLGTLSFQVDPDHLEEMTSHMPFETNPMLTKAHPEDWQTGNDLMYPLEQATPGITGFDRTGWTIGFLNELDQTDIKADLYDNSNDANIPKSNLHIKYEISDVIIRAEAAEKEVTINAYQAYTDATPADLAATLQRYSSTVRLTYPDGDQRDEAMFWGKEEMTVVDNNTGDSYVFRYDGSGGYTFQKLDAAGNPIPGDASGDYDPTHGDYTIKQPYIYEEEGETKQYPTPITVHLTVTPVKVIGITANDLQMSYKINDPDLPDETGKLALPEEGRLVFDTVLSGTIPTVPLTTWTNGTAPVTVLTPTTNMGDLVGEDNAPLPNPVNWPTTAAEIASNTGVGTYNFNCADPTQQYIQAIHPWATVTDNFDVDAQRVIKADNVVERRYVATATVNDLYGIQTITVNAVDPNDGVTVIQMGTSTFDIYRPDGVRVDPSWFSSNTVQMNNNGGAHTTQANGLAYNIFTHPGDSALGHNGDEREITRRHINLGGYFTVVVHESLYGTSDPIRVYQPRRQNAYLYNYNVGPGDTLSPTDWPEFDFTGHKAGLYPFYRYSKLPNTVVLPLDCGYIVHTRYDGVTGAEPGEVRSFSVNNWLQTSPAPAATSPYWAAGDVVTYGPDLFSNHSYGSGFGLVENPFNRVAQVKVEVQDEVTPPEESLRLTYEGAPAPSNILNLPDGQVGTVAFDTVREGYAYKQEFELTLTNDGTTDIHGIYIDALLGPTQNPVPDGEQHFEIIKPPATDLAPGASTTFIITYVLGLEKGQYIDNIYVGTANSGTQPAKTFIARFKVTDGQLYKLTVQPRPEDGAMGTGGAVTGVDSGVYDNTPVGSNLEANDPVWISVKPLDEYDIKKNVNGDYEVYYYDESNTKIYLTQYVPMGTSDKPADGEYLFYLPGGMPPRDTVVYVDFYEPIPSKLRLSDLHAYASEQESDCITDPKEQTMYDMTDPTYGTTGFDPDHTDYLVVVPAEADWSGLKLTLYDIVVPYEIINPPEGPLANAIITPDVHIELDDLGSTAPLDVRGSVGSTSAATPVQPTTHEMTFRSPDPGKAKTATITISYYDAANNTRYERVDKYKVKFIRKTDIPIHTFAYGNTPYGMIMNADNIAPGDKTAAKESFDKENRFTETAYTPTKAATLTDYIYWPEAWQAEYSDWPANWGERNLDRNDYALVAYVGEIFQDPGIRELLDSTGTPVKDQTLTRTVEVALLDPNGTTNSYPVGTTAGRFNGTETATIDLGPLTVNSNGEAGLTGVTALVNWETNAEQLIRPGIYALTYTFTDFDGTTRSFSRPLVILKHLGDVDASGGAADSEAAPDPKDSEDIRMRIIEPHRLGDNEEVVNYPDYDKEVYRYRICDANDDRNINDIDANRIQNEATLTDFYRPVDYIG